MVTPSKKARTSPTKTGTVGNNKRSLPTLVSCFARPGAQEFKVAVLVLLTSGAKRARFEVPSEEAPAPVLKVFYELPEHWTSTAMMAQAARP